MRPVSAVLLNYRMPQRAWRSNKMAKSDSHRHLAISRLLGAGWGRHARILLQPRRHALLRWDRRRTPAPLPSCRCAVQRDVWTQVETSDS